MVSGHAYWIVELILKKSKWEMQQPNKKSKATTSDPLLYSSWLADFLRILFTHILAYLFISFLSHNILCSRRKEIWSILFTIVFSEYNRVTPFIVSSDHTLVELSEWWTAEKMGKRVLVSFSVCRFLNSLKLNNRGITRRNVKSHSASCDRGCGRWEVFRWKSI